MRCRKGTRVGVTCVRLRPVCFRMSNVPYGFNYVTV
jgi:hypothetical protein